MVSNLSSASLLSDLSIPQQQSSFAIKSENKKIQETSAIFKEITKYFPKSSQQTISQIIYDYYNTSQYQFLANTDDFILYQMPVGKPDPNEICSPQTLECDQRARICQPAYKNNTCWYYSLNTIRQRIGKKPTKDLVEARKIEKICSERRKEVSRGEASLPAVFDQLANPQVYNVFCKWDKNKVIAMSTNWGTYKKILETEETLEGRPSLYPFLIGFQKQDKLKNFYEYLRCSALSPRNQANEKFFQKIGRSPADIFKEARRIDQVAYNAHFNNQDQWEKLTDIQRHALLDRYAMNASAELYGLKKSSWTPFKSIQYIITELRDRGPLVVGGLFGHPLYNTAPFKMQQQVGGRDIFAWKPGTRKQDAFFAHTITIIGGRKINDKEFIYYIDPVDSSDPTCIATQKIYLISYQSLRENVININGTWHGDRAESSAGYAWVSGKW